jgi:DUF438 domain-containing protein
MENKTLGIGSRVKHPEYGDGVVIQTKLDYYLITFIEIGTRKIAKIYEGLKVIDDIEPSDDLISFEQIEASLINILRKFSDIQETVHISDKWKNGKFVLQPSDSTLKNYEMPIDTFFHKIVMVRDRLRVLEQRINSNEKLGDDEKVELQQYITRSYGSLTSFNILFKNKTDNFVGEKVK